MDRLVLSTKDLVSTIENAEKNVHFWQRIKPSNHPLFSLGKSFYIFVKKLLDFDPETSKKKFDLPLRKQLQFLFRSVVAHIEFVDANKNLKKIFFKVPKMCLSAWQRTEFQDLTHELTNDMERYFFDIY